MVNVPLVIVHVALNIVSGLLTLLFLIGKRLVVLSLFLVKVALIVASCSAAVLAPVAHADPAEVVLAL